MIEIQSPNELNDILIILRNNHLNKNTQLDISSKLLIVAVYLNNFTNLKPDAQQDISNTLKTLSKIIDWILSRDSTSSQSK